MAPDLVTAAHARRLLLAGQGLLDDPGRPATLRALRSLIEQLGFVQVDSINTVARAHHLTLQTRLSGYHPEQLTTLLEKERFLFEHWTHDASVIPTALYPYWWTRFRRADERVRGNAWWQGRLGKEHRAVVNAIRRRLRRQGEVRSEDFEAARNPAEKGWWGWSPHKAAMELMWHRGELAVTRREHFQKVYARADDVLGEARALPRPSPAEHLDWACRTALDRLGVATPRELATYWAAVPLADARRWVAASERSGRIVSVRVVGAGRHGTVEAWAWPDWRERVRALAEPPDGLRLLCPFDPILRDRRRALHRFDFDYRFEAFVPAAKRKYGYYVLPLLEGDRLVGRVDPKLHRDREHLAIQKVFWEPGVRPDRALRGRLEAACERFARWLGAHSVELAE